MTCPKCAAGTAESLGAVRSSLEWFRCRECLHVWPARRLAAPEAVVGPPVTCRKCGRITARPIGRSAGIFYVQCDTCGHTSARTE